MFVHLGLHVLLSLVGTTKLRLKVTDAGPLLIHLSFSLLFILWSLGARRRARILVFDLTLVELQCHFIITFLNAVLILKEVVHVLLAFENCQNSWHKIRR